MKYLIISIITKAKLGDDMLIQLGGEFSASIATGETLAGKIIARAGTMDIEEQRIISGLASVLKKFPVSIASYGFSPEVKYEVRIREFLFSFEKNPIPFYGLQFFSPTGLEHITLSYDGSENLIQSILLKKDLWRIEAGHICLEISTRKTSKINLPEKVYKLEAAQTGFKKISDITILN